MQVVDIKKNRNKNFLLDKQCLLELINKSSKYFNKETIEYLNSLVMLEQAVFNNIEFGEYFGRTELFYEIAKYNLCNRTIQTLEKLSSLDQDKLTAVFSDSGMSICYNMLKDDSSTDCYVYTSYFNDLINPSKSNLSLYTYSDVDKKISKLEQQIKMFSQMEENSNTINLLQQMRGSKLFLEKYGHIEEEISQTVINTLCDDWKMDFENIPTEGYVKHLSWIDVHKK